MRTDDEKEACEKLLENDDGNGSGMDRDGEIEYKATTKVTQIAHQIK